MIITIILILFQKRPLQPISTVTIDHDVNDDKNVDDELDKGGDDRHHSFVIAIGHVMSGHNDGVSKSVVLCLSAFVETPTRQFYFCKTQLG